VRAPSHHPAGKLRIDQATGTFQQVNGLTKPQTDLLAKLAIPHPKQVIDLQPTPR